jgi:hypothetical protein
LGGRDPLIPYVVSDEGLQGLRDSGNCPAAAETEMVAVILARLLSVRADIGGCTSGGAATVRQAADALVARLRALPVPDAAPATDAAADAGP